MTIVTHNGKFHADDVFAVATLLLFLKDKKVEIVRTRDEDKIKVADFVVDVGGMYDPKTGRFDHHQPEGAGSRPNSVSYASFGLVWKEFGEEICKDKAVASHVDRRLVQDIDAIDNGLEIYHTDIKDVVPFTVGDVVDGFLPTWHETDHDEAFKRALNFANETILNEVRRQSAANEGYKLARKAYENASDKRIIELEQHYPWSRELTRYPEPLYVIGPYGTDGKWMVRAVPVYPRELKVRKALPELWRGISGQELQNITGIGDALFVHRNGFMATTTSREGALALARKALENNNS